jgi:S-adenosylmethionine:tRNA ribosyltransferase-isomerase
MRLDDFDFDLPTRLIAQTPLESRGESRLLTLNGETGEIADRRFAELPELIHARDVVVLNDTRVLKARLFARKPTGGKVEVLIERVADSRFAMALLRASHLPRSGSPLEVGDGVHLRVLERQGDLYRLEVLGALNWPEVLERHGEMPLPPYIARPSSADDEVRYQTVFAKELGAVAAPTAGLHFDKAMLETLSGAGTTLAFLTLHVGPGTFQPVRSVQIEQHRMHAERYILPADTVTAIERARASGGRVVAVGTTSLRVLESAARGDRLEAGTGETDLFITPGFKFRAVDVLLTNFHLPRSTLLMLVAAFAGLDKVLDAYRHAVEQGYRFFSYGDAMLIERAS